MVFVNLSVLRRGENLISRKLFQKIRKYIMHIFYIAYSFFLSRSKAVFRQWPNLTYMSSSHPKRAIAFFRVTRPPVSGNQSYVGLIWFPGKIFAWSFWKCIVPNLKIIISRLIKPLEAKKSPKLPVTKHF